MAIKCFCDSCGKEIDNPKKCISVLIRGIPHLPDLCEECIKKIADMMYQYSGDINHDDKE